MSERWAVPDFVMDAWVNPNLGLPKGPFRNIDHLFPEYRQRAERGTTLAQLIDEMDASGVTRAVLSSGASQDYDELSWVRDAIGRHPDRFIGSTFVDPHTGMAGVRQIESLVSNDGFRLIRLRGSHNRLTYDSAEYYPIYAKCVELGIPVGVNVGLPGPLLPGHYQHPLAIDTVCAFFPELTVVLQHGGDPWVDECISMMRRWTNLHYMTSAYTPRRIPQQIIRFANSRLGHDKVMHGSDYPVLRLDHCVDEARDLAFRDQETFDAFIGGNARRLFCPA